MPASEIERLTTEAADLVKRAMEIGVQMERARVRALLSADSDFVVDLRDTPMVRRRARGLATRGPIVLVRKALSEMPMPTEGVDANDVLSFVQANHPAEEMTDKRIRGALKQLVNTGEAKRASRGRYLPRSSSAKTMAEENPEVSASGLFSLAAA